MPRAVRFDHYGDVDVLYIAEVQVPEPAAGHVVVRVCAAGVNFGENAIRSGVMDQMAPAHFPEGQGTEFAGLVHTVGPDVFGVAPGDAVIGFSDTRNAQADYVALPADHVLPKPPQLDWGAAQLTHRGRNRHRHDPSRPPRCR